MPGFRAPGEASTEGEHSAQSTTAATLRRVIAQLEHLDPGTARLVDALASILARVADADAEMVDQEREEMESVLSRHARLSPEEAVLVVELARHRNRSRDCAGSYSEARSLRSAITTELRERLLECLYAVAAADGLLKGCEQAEILQIATELGISRSEAVAALSQKAALNA